MAVTVRPPADRLVVRVYDRAVHPEWLDTLAVRRVVRPAFTLTVRLTPDGHAVELATPAGTLTELLTGRDADLPAAGLALETEVTGGRRAAAVLTAARYGGSSHAETLAPEAFAHAHAELVHDAAKRGLIAHLPAHHRLGLAPVGYVTVDPVPGGLAVAGFHTFPDDFTVVKTQSLLEFPGANE